jgi:competence ComEA-like helix-hairpin-helix protein
MMNRLAARHGRLLTLTLLSWLLIAAQVSCVKLPRRASFNDGQTGSAAASVNPSNLDFIDINTATRGELEQLPGIGEALASRIIEHREKYGRFRRLEHLLLVRGISERRYRTISERLKVE